MLKLYTDLKYFDGKDGILIIDYYFNTYVKANMLSKRELDIIYKYENAVLYEDDIFKGPFGAFLLKEISTGVKVLLVLSLIYDGKLEKPSFINISECGENLFSEVINYLNVLQIPALLINSSLNEVEDFDCIVDDKYQFNNISHLIHYLISSYSNQVGKI